MAVHMVSYDLKVKNKDNQELREAIEKYENIHLHESLWLIDTQQKPSVVRDNLESHLKDGDKLFVCRLQRKWASYNAGSKNIDGLKSDDRTWSFIEIGKGHFRVDFFLDKVDLKKSSRL